MIIDLNENSKLIINSSSSGIAVYHEELEHEFTEIQTKKSMQYVYEISQILTLPGTDVKIDRVDGEYVIYIAEYIIKPSRSGSLIFPQLSKDFYRTGS